MMEGASPSGPLTKTASSRPHRLLNTHPSSTKSMSTSTSSGMTPSPPATLSTSLKAIGYGFKDSIFGIRAIFQNDPSNHVHTTPSDRRRSGSPSQSRGSSSSPENITLNRITKCCMLNGGVFGASIIMFEYMLIPFLQWGISLWLGSESGLTSTVWFWLRPLLSYTFGALWILPLFCISRVINVFWFQDVANSAFRGRIKSMNFPTLVADTLYSLIIQALFLLQATLVVMVPISYIGPLISMVFMSILYALYSFEYKWFNTGWDTPRRLYFIENNWTYFFGFGLPMCLITGISSSYFINGTIFSVVFPFFIVSANEAKVSKGLWLVSPFAAGHSSISQFTMIH